MISHAFALVVALVVSLASSRTGAGPVAIALLDGRDKAAVLQSDGDVLAMNLTSGAVQGRLYRIPDGFHATNMVASRRAARPQVGAGADTGAGAPVLFFAISGSVGGSVGGSAAKQSFILQRHADGREVWSWLRDPGAYINLTIDDADDDGDGHDAPVIYIANATSNTIYRVVAGDETHRVEQVVRLASARRLGPMAFDPASHRLFVADLDRVPTRLYAIDVTRRRMLSMISLDAVDEIRSLVWDAVTQRLYAADSGQERIWRIDVASPPAPARAPARTSVQPQAEVGARPRTGHARVETLARHERMKQPVGMALTTSATDASGRSIWVVDHSARMALQMSMPDGVVTRILSCEPP